jgi:hypothetical protein
MSDEEMSDDEEIMASNRNRRIKIKSYDDDVDYVDEVEDEEYLDEEPVDSLSINMLNYALKNKSKLNFDLVLSGSDVEPIYYIFADKKPVATATLAKASDAVKNIFGSQKYVDAFSAILAEDEVNEQAIEDMGIEPIKTDIPVDEAVNHQVNESVELATAQYNLTKEDVKNKIERCIGIAAVGITKNILEGVDNPLRDALIAELKSVAVRNPEHIVDKVMASHGEEFLRLIIQKGMELTAKSDTALDEIANMVKSVKPTISIAEPIKEESPAFPFMATASHSGAWSNNDDLADKRRRVVASLNKARI